MNSRHGRDDSMKLETSLLKHDTTCISEHQKNWFRNPRWWGYSSWD